MESKVNQVWSLTRSTVRNLSVSHISDRTPALRLSSVVLSTSNMDSDICLNSSIWDFSDHCVRMAWSAILPVSLVILIGFSYAPLPDGVSKICASIASPFQTFISLEEAEALDEAGEHSADSGEHDDKPKPTVPLWRTVLLSWIALLEALVWFSISFFHLVTYSKDFWYSMSSIAIAVTWLYAFARPTLRPTITPPYDVFALLLCHLAAGILLLGGVVYDWFVSEDTIFDWFALTGTCVNLSVITVLLVVILQMPLAIPSNRVCRDDIVCILLYSNLQHIIDVH
jgi:hypothetical protein